MKHAWIVLLLLGSVANADFLGTWHIDDYVPIIAATHQFSTGAAMQPTVLTYSIYEDGGTTGIAENVDMTVASPFDSVVGVYLARVQLTAASGFETGKNYIVVVKATVDSVSAVAIHTFQIEAVVTASIWQEQISSYYTTVGSFAEALYRAAMRPRP